MNAEALLKHYERIADAPDAVGRLRRFVLDLAVRGKLVPQIADETRHPELIDRLKNIGHAQADLRNGWLSSSVGTLLDFQYGSALKASDRLSDGPVPVYGSNGVVGFTDTALTEKPSIIIGRKGSAGALNLANGPSWTTDVAYFVEPPPFLDLRFLFNLLASLSLDKLGKGVKPGLSRADAYAQSVSIPPLAEQHRIVAKVDELMALCDQLEATRTKREATRDRLAAASLARLNTPDPDPETFKAHASFAISTALPALTTRTDQIKQLRQTIINLAVRGKLVMQDPDDEPASKMIRRIKSSKLAAYDAEGLRVRAPVQYPTRHDLKFDFPLSWDLAAFDELFVIISGVTLGQKIPANESIDVPYLRVANVQRGYLALDVIKTVPVRKSDLQRFLLRAGDILMTEGGDWDKLGRAAIWQCEVPDCIHQNHVFRVRSPSAEILPEWVTTYVNSVLGRAFFEDASKQTTNLASINMTQLRSCPIPVPPIAEQDRIVAKVKELMQLCDQLEASLESGSVARRRLLDALLHEALAPAKEFEEAA